MKEIQLRGGARVPALGLGTWKSDPGEVGAAVQEAVEIGYRHFDCAAIYGNEAEIGAALAGCISRGLVKRDELWITSKLWNDRHERDEVVPALKESLQRLGLDYLDLYLIHWPVAHRKGVLGPASPDDMIPLDTLPLATTWEGMQAALRTGLTRHIGVSNCSARKLEALVQGADPAPEMNQVELHPYLQQPRLLEACREHGVAVTAYSPLGSGDRVERLKQAGEPILLEDETLTDIAQRLGATPAQVLIAWAIERDTCVIPKSVNPARLRENFAAANLHLSDPDMTAIATLDRARRYIDGSFWALDGSGYTVSGLWDE